MRIKNIILGRPTGTSQDDIFYTSIKKYAIYACIKNYRAWTDVYATFMHPYKRCLKYTNSFIQVLGGTQYVDRKNIDLATPLYARFMFSHIRA